MRENAGFKAARDADKAAAKLKGTAAGGSDNYFLTRGRRWHQHHRRARRDLCREHFAFHTSGNATHWPARKQFWIANL